MNTKIIVPAAMALALVVSLPVFAEETSGSNSTSTSSVGTSTSSGSFRDRLEHMKQQIADFKAGKMNGQGERRSGGQGNAMSLKNASSTCIQALSDTRELAIQAAWTTFSTSVTTNLTTRQKAIYDAWSMSTSSARATALNTAWQTWKTSQKDALKKLNTSRLAAWKTFKTDARAQCKVNVPASEGLAPDTSGNIAL